MLSSVVTLASKSKVAPAALLELGTACDLFERAAAYGGRATKFIVSIDESSHFNITIYTHPSQTQKFVPTIAYPPASASESTTGLQ